MHYRILEGASANFPLPPVGNLSLSGADWSRALEINLPPMRPACLPKLCLCLLSSDSERSTYFLLPELARLDKNILRAFLLVGKNSRHFLKILCSSLVLPYYSSLFPLSTKAMIKWESYWEAADLSDLGGVCSEPLFSYPLLETVGLDNTSSWPFSSRVLWSECSYFSWLL